MMAVTDLAFESTTIFLTMGRIHLFCHLDQGELRIQFYSVGSGSGIWAVWDRFRGYAEG